MLAIWKKETRTIDSERLRLLLTLRTLVPGNTFLGPRIWLRARLPIRVVRQWDRLRARLRPKRLGGVLAPMVRDFERGQSKKSLSVSQDKN